MDRPATGRLSLLWCEVANSEKLLLVTEDKDFGELAYRLKLEHNGILLIRLRDLPRNERVALACEIIKNYFDKLNGNFSVLSKSGLRIKTALNKNS